MTMKLLSLMIVIVNILKGKKRDIEYLMKTKKRAINTLFHMLVSKQIYKQEEQFNHRISFLFSSV